MDCYKSTLERFAAAEIAAFARRTEARRRAWSRVGSGAAQASGSSSAALVSSAATVAGAPRRIGRGCWRAVRLGAPDRLGKLF